MSKPVPFAHLLGFGKKARAEESQDDNEAKRAQWAKLAEEDPEREQKDDESDEDYEARMKAMDEEEEQDEEARRAESDLDGADDQDPDKDGDKDAKKAARAARASERARCAAIVAAGIKTNQLHAACSLAFDTTMSASQASSVLAMARQDKNGSSLGNRMAGVDIPNPGAAIGKSGGDALTDKMVAFAQKFSSKR